VNSAITDETTTIPFPMLAEPIAEVQVVVMELLITAKNVTTRTTSMMMVAHVAEKTVETESNKETKNVTMALPTATLSQIDADPTANDTFAEMV